MRYNEFDQGVEVKVGDKVFTDSARANGRWDPTIRRDLNKEFRRATFTAVWDENVENDKKETTVKVFVNGNVNQSKIVQKGDIVEFNVPVTNVTTLAIQVPAGDNGGLSIVNGVLYR